MTEQRKAPDAGQGIEGSESHRYQQTGDPTMFARTARADHTMTRVEGTTEHLEQILDDMRAAGPGATDSRTFRAIVAELEARRAATTDVDVLTGSVTAFDRDQPTEVQAVCIDTDNGGRQRVVFVDGTSYTEIDALLLAGAILDAADVLAADRGDRQ